jgi:hypothetical protein
MDSMGTDDGSHSTISIDPPSDTFHRTSGSNRSLKSVFSAVSNITKIVNNVTKVHEMDKIKRHSVKAERDRQRLALNKVFCRRAEVKDCYTKEDYVLLMQHTFRQSRGKPQRRLDRSNFIDRLQHEDDTLMGTIRLMNLILVFAMMLLSIQFSYSMQERSSIREALDSQFKFEDISRTTNKDAFWGMLKQVHSGVDTFFPILKWL